MDLARFRRLLLHLDRVANERGVYVPVLAWGESGVGKSETVRSVADELGIGFVDLRLGQQEVGDLIGLPREETVYPCAFCLEAAVEEPVGPHRYPRAALLAHLREAHAHEPHLEALPDPGARLGEAVERAVDRFPHLVDLRTVHARPDWFPEAGTRGFLFLDELNRSHLDVRQAVFQLVLDRRLHRHVLPDGWLVVSAVNPATEDYETADLTDKAFLARFLHVAFEPGREEWLAFATARGVDWSIRALVGEDGRFLGDTTVQMPRIRPTPRTWILLDQVLEDLPEDLEQEVAAGLVGPEAAVAWIRLRASAERPVPASAVLADYDAVRGRVRAYASSAANRSDLLKVTLDDLAVVAEERALTPDEVSGLARFLLDCPPDLAYAYLKLRFIRNPRLRAPLSARDELIAFVTRINREAGLDG